MNAFQKMTGLSILIVSLSVAYYFVIYLPKKESAVIELQKQEQIKKEQKEKEQMQVKEEAKKALDACIIDAEVAGDNYWNDTCRAKGLLSQSCIDFLDKGVKVYLDKSMSFDEISSKRKECSCLLTLSNADRVNESTKEAKDVCFRKYPQK